MQPPAKDLLEANGVSLSWAVFLNRRIGLRGNSSADISQKLSSSSRTLQLSYNLIDCYTAVP